MHERNQYDAEGMFITWERFTRAYMYRHFHKHVAVVTPQTYEQSSKKSKSLGQIQRIKR